MSFSDALKLKKSPGRSPKATKSIAGGNATGWGRDDHSDPERVAPVTRRLNNDARNCSESSTLSGSDRPFTRVPVALPPAIEFVAFGDSCPPLQTRACRSNFDTISDALVFWFPPSLWQNVSAN